MADRPYVRVYHDIVDDPKFATVYDDARCLGTWLRLLIVAEQAYPNSATFPSGTHKASVAKLADAGLIDLGNAGRYRVHGLASEREMRSQSARNAAAVRWQSDSNASTRTSTSTRTSKQEDAGAHVNGKDPVLRPLRSSRTVLEAAEKYREGITDDR